VGRGRKEDSVKLTNNDFLVKKKIQQKNQRENRIFWYPEAVRNHFWERNGSPCAEETPML
jgi:hypothetical protein